MASDVRLISSFKFPGGSVFLWLITLYQAVRELHSDLDLGIATKYIHTFDILLFGKPGSLADTVSKYKAGGLRSRLSFSRQTVTQWA